MNREHIETSENLKNTHIKIIQIIIVIILLISAFYIGKLSMAKQIHALNSRVNQLEVEINEIQTESQDETVNTP